MTIVTWLTHAIRRLLEAGIPSARLDAELILAHTVRQGRTWLRAHDDEPLEGRLRDIADARLALRLDRVPVAYIIGHKDFYGRRFTVTTSTLIPRPESEAMLELLAGILDEHPSLRESQLVDVGTGSGCLGITAKLEHPSLAVSLVDTSTHALNVAKKNADRLGADVTTMRSDLLSGYPHQPAIILANLPYVDPDWERSPELEHEPADALYASDDGLALITQLIDQATTRLAPEGWLLLEADLRQHHALTHYAEKAGFAAGRSSGLIVSFYRAR